MKELTGVVYCYHNLVNGKKYIGLTINEKKRKVTRQNKVESGRGNSHFHHAIRKYGWDAFVYGVIEECPREELSNRERYWINYYNTYEKGYNSTTGGEGGYERSEEYKAKLSAACVGRNHTEETKAKLSAANKGKKKGPMPEEQKAKISAANKGKNKGRKHSEKTKAKMSSGSTGKRHTEETKAKMSKLNNDQVKEAIRLIEGGMKKGEVAKEMKVASSTLRNAITRYTNA